MSLALYTRSCWLFDLDGTLVDSSAGVIRAFHCAQAEFGEAPADATAIRSRIGYPFEETVARLSAIPFSGFLTAFRREAMASMHSDSFLLPGVRQLLHMLELRGHRLAIVTSKRRDNAQQILAHLGVADCFEVIVGADSAARIKPDPAPIIAALTALGTTLQETLMVGDTRNDIEAARAAGMPVIAVASGVDPGDRLADADECVADAASLLKRLVAAGRKGGLLMYTAAHCPLCDELKDELHHHRLRFTERDISTQPTWYRRYRERIPVVLDHTGREFDPPHTNERLTAWQRDYG